MKRNYRTLSVAVFASMLLFTVSSCKKKAPVAPPPPPPAPTKEVTPPPAPAATVRINSFTAEPRSIEQGQSATLRWSVANATDIAIDQGLGQVAANGNRQVFPSNTVTYTLTARSGGGGSDTRAVTVEVSAPPPPPPPPPTKSTISGADMLNREAQDAYFDYD